MAAFCKLDNQKLRLQQAHTIPYNNKVKCFFCEDWVMRGIELEFSRCKWL